MSVISRTSYRRYSRRKAQPNFALMVIAFCLAAFVWGNYQINYPPSCGSASTVGFMNISAGTAQPKPCDAGEQPVQVSFSDAMGQNVKNLLNALPSAS